MKICPLGAEFFHMDGGRKRRTHRKADMTNLMVALRDFANAPNKSTRSQHRP